MKKVGSLMLSFVKAFGVREIFMVTGLVFLGYGVSLFNFAAAFVVVGSIMVSVAIFGVKSSAAVPKNDVKDADLRRRG